MPALALSQDYPNKPVRAIVPTNAGGSVDSVARIIQRFADSDAAFGQKIAVVNMDGAGGTIGTRAVHDAEPDGYTIGLWHEGLITSAVMGVTDFDHTDFTILGITGYSEIGLGTGDRRQDRRFQGPDRQGQGRARHAFWSPPTSAWRCISCR